MEEYRSKSYGDGRMEMESYYNYGGGGINGAKPSSSPSNGWNSYSSSHGQQGFQDLRCYSASYATSSATHHPPPPLALPPPPSMVAPPKGQLRKGKSANGSMSGWCFSDPELQRKKRVASYKAYSVEGKVKRSFSKSFRWLKDRYTHMVHGW